MIKIFSLTFRGRLINSLEMVLRLVCYNFNIREDGVSIGFNLLEMLFIFILIVSRTP